MPKGKARALAQDLMRGEHVVGEGTRDAEAGDGVSIFDPVLCELIYRWFCPPSGAVLDPFAGGSVRGIVASRLGRSYIGVDLSAEQVIANVEQAGLICSHPMPKWIIGDSSQLAELPIEDEADLVFTCPPYGDLEVYTDDPKDLSNMPHEEFIAKYRIILNAACSRLKNNRFAVVVIGDARDKHGNYYGLPWRTVEAMQLAGLKLYNEAVLVTAVGSLPVRVKKQFEASRKMGKTHQNVLVFIKGDAKKATDAIGRVSFGKDEVDAEEAAAASSW